MSEEAEELIAPGNYVVVKRQSFKKLYKVTENGHLTLGKMHVDMKAIIGKRFWSTFEIVPGKQGRQSLREVSEAESWDDLINELPSGNDNRGIVDDGTSQKLSKDEILQLQESGKTGKEIVGTLIENSKSFLEKTSYSQEKYLKKKEQKYYRYIMILKPDIRTIHEIYFKLDRSKIGGLRMDALSQLLSYSDVQADGVFLLYDSGTQGLPAAAMLNRIGANTQGQLIHMHPGNMPQMTLVNGMNFPKEQLDRLLNVNIYSFLRLYYQGEEAVFEQQAKEKEQRRAEDNARRNKRQKKFNDNTNNIVKEEAKVDVTNNIVEEGIKVDNPKDSQTAQENSEQETRGDSEQPAPGSKENNEDLNSLKRKAEADDQSPETTVPKRPRWFYETKNAVELVQKQKARGLAIVAREHPLNIVAGLFPFLGVSRPFVIFHQHREPLQETYMALKQKHSVVNLRLVTNFLRGYQVLPDRTHPEIVTSDTGGYLLTGYLVE